MKNKLIDLNNHLFSQLERLSDESITGKELAEEVNRSKAISSISKDIILNGRLALDAQKAVRDGLISQRTLPQMLEVK
jgi:hypothetical protein